MIPLTPAPSLPVSHGTNGEGKTICGLNSLEVSISNHPDCPACKAPAPGPTAPSDLETAFRFGFAAGHNAGMDANSDDRMRHNDSPDVDEAWVEYSALASTQSAAARLASLTLERGALAELVVLLASNCTDRIDVTNDPRYSKALALSHPLPSSGVQGG